MSLGDSWVSDIVETGSASIDILTLTTSPFVGTRYVRFGGTTPGSGSPAGSGALYLVDPPFTRGFPLGILRTLIRCDTSQQTHAGFFCMASQDVGIADAGSVYTIGIDSSRRIGVWKITSGGLVSGTRTEILLTDDVLTPGTRYGLEIEWHADVENFGGVEFIVKLGTALDFSDLALIATETDTTSPLLVSAAEGLYLTTQGVSQTSTVSFDQSTITEITIA